jgi:hypothetical protein
MKLSFGFINGDIVDGCMALLHETVLVKLPVFIACRVNETQCDDSERRYIYIYIYIISLDIAHD